ncbi:MAG: hypothetical protein HYT72_01750 [Candidatus Aenigmarchaeota archaeon]|nr:hypothetical protein [Candidatus Aenigmarchaeota archaeon]
MQEPLKNDTVVIYADTREAGSKVVAILKNRCSVVEKQMVTGDYVLSRHVAAERKVSGDFLQSIVDGRLFNQLSELKNSFRVPILVIEGETLFDSNRQIHPNAIRGAIASIATEFAIPIIWTKNQLETAEMLYTIAKREQIAGKKHMAIRVKKKFRSVNQMQEFLVSGIPQISTETAKKLLKHFGSPEKIFAAGESELKNVDGIGDKTAKKIRLILSKKYEKSILED